MPLPQLLLLQPLLQLLLLPLLCQGKVQVEVLAPKQLVASLQEETFLAVFWRE